MGAAAILGGRNVVFARLVVFLRGCLGDLMASWLHPSSAHFLAE